MSVVFGDKVSSFLTLREAVVYGGIPGAFPIKKFGHNGSVRSPFETVWDHGGIYEYLSSSSLISVASTSADDVNGGSGCHQVTVHGLDENWNIVSEDIFLNGTVPVVSANKFIRVFKMECNYGGDLSGGCIGDVYAGVGAFSSGVPAHVLAHIAPGLNQTLMALYTVPAGMVGYIYDFYSNSGRASEAKVDSYFRKHGEYFKLKRRVDIYESTFPYANSVPFRVEAKTDIEIRAQGTTDTPVSSGFDMILLPEEFSLF